MFYKEKGNTTVVHAFKLYRIFISTFSYFQGEGGKSRISCRGKIVLKNLWRPPPPPNTPRLKTSMNAYLRNKSFLWDGCNQRQV